MFRASRAGFVVVTLVAALVSGGQPPRANGQPRLDRHGDPLPEGALTRLGTVRLRENAERYGICRTASIETIAHNGETVARKREPPGAFPWLRAAGQD